jgi:hypothetical protein
MKSVFIFFVLLTTLMVESSSVVRAQGRDSAAESADNIKLQLIEITAKEEMAKIRIQQLDEALKPENIERSLAGVGSTRPEQLREQLRRQLTIEKTAVVAQVEQLGVQRARLESALSAAEANAYQQSARSTPSIENASEVSISPRWLMLMGIAALLAIGLSIAAFLRLKNANLQL